MPVLAQLCPDTAHDGFGEGLLFETVGSLRQSACPDGNHGKRESGNRISHHLPPAEIFLSDILS
jgi:hypothetical protein